MLPISAQVTASGMLLSGKYLAPSFFSRLPKYGLMSGNFFFFLGDTALAAPALCSKMVETGSGGSLRPVSI